MRNTTGQEGRRVYTPNDHQTAKVADKSSIEWTEATWNPTRGCDRITSGCHHCYALSLAKRLKAMGNPKYQVDGDPRTSGPGSGVQVHADVLDIPRRWASPRVVFVDSMSDCLVPGLMETMGRPEEVSR